MKDNTIELAEDFLDHMHKIENTIDKIQILMENIRNWCYSALEQRHDCGNANQQEKTETDQSVFEAKRGFVSRMELNHNILDLMDDLTDEDYHSLYHLLWTLSTHRMQQRHEEQRKKRGDQI